MTVYYPPPKVMRVAARGVGWHNQTGRGSPSSLQVAQKLLRREAWDVVQLVALVKWFGAHEVDRIADGWNPNEPGFPSDLRVNWDLHGGDEARTWCNSVARSSRGREQEQQAKKVNA